MIKVKIPGAGSIEIGGAGPTPQDIYRDTLSYWKSREEKDVGICVYEIKRGPKKKEKTNG